MTKRQFSNICSLYSQVSNRLVIIQLIIDICRKKNSDPAPWIEDFYQKKVIAAYDKECFAHSCEIDELKEKIKQLEQNILALGGEVYEEPK